MPIRIQPHRQRREGGYAALWVLILLALLGVSGFAFASMAPDMEMPIPWVLGCVVVAAIGLGIEARQDFYEFCRFAGFFAFVGAMGCGLVVGLGEQSHPVAFVSAIALGLTSIAAAVASHRISSAEEILPNLLLDQFAKSDLSELGGVQFRLTHSDIRVHAGGEFLVKIHAQNGMDTERTFELRLKRPIEIGRGGHLAFDKEARMILPAGAAGTLTIPVAVHTKARHSYSIDVDPKVIGSGGNRLRVYRARAFSQKVSGGAQMLGLLGGFLISGGGFTIKLKVSKNKNWKNMPVDEPSPSASEILYQPDRALMEQIRLRM